MRKFQVKNSKNGVISIKRKETILRWLDAITTIIGVGSGVVICLIAVQSMDDSRISLLIILGFLFLVGLLAVFIAVCGKINDKKINSKYDYREYLLKELNNESAQTIEDKKTVQEEGSCEAISKNSGYDETQKPINNINVVTDNTYCELGDDSAIIQTQIKKDILALMLKNNDEIAEYFTISKKQAKSSYRLSVITCIIGIAMLGIAIYGAIVINNLQLTIIGTTSGAITEVIAGTVLWIHNKSALQLNYYYDALHENEKFLSVINIADKLKDDKRDEMYIEIIRKQLEIQK